MQNAESLSQEQIREFLKSRQPIEFGGCGRSEKYAWVEHVLGGAELWEVEQGGAGWSASLRGKSNGDERGADDATDPRVSGPRGGEGVRPRGLDGLVD